MPVMRAGRKESPEKNAAVPASQDLHGQDAEGRQQAAAAGCCRKKPISSSMPMETKKKLVKTSLKGQDLSEGLMAVFGVRDDQPRQKGAEGQGEAGRMGEPGDGQADGQRGDQKQLPAPGLGDAEKDAGDEPLARGMERADTMPTILPPRMARVRHSVCCVPASSGISSIIGTTAMSWKMRMPRAAFPWGVSISARSWRIFMTMAVLLRAKRESRRKSPPRGPKPESRATAKVHRTVSSDLQGPAQQDRFADPEEAPEGEFQADGEHQQDDARFRQRLDRFDLVDQGESVRSGQDARQEKADDDGQPDPVAKVNHDDGQQNDDQDVVEEECVHFLASPKI